MRITVNINDDILKKASSLTGIKEKTSLIHRALESAKRLANLGGSEPKLRPIRRRRSAPPPAHHGPC
jgi:hypothetical protein